METPAPAPVVDPALAAPEHEPLQIAILDVSQARHDAARDIADARLGAETQSGGGVRGFIRKIWKGNLAHEYYRQKYTREARKQIDASGNLYAGEEGLDDRAARGSVVERFTSFYADDMLHSGERRVEVDDGRANPFRGPLSELFGKFARDELSEGAFEEEKNRILKDLVGANPSAFGEGIAFADNLRDIARNVKAQIDHGKSLEEVMASAKFVVGEARMGVRSKANYNRVDRVVERLHKTRLGSLVNEATLATAASIVVGVTKWGAQRTTGAALAATGAIGASGAAFAAIRENKRFKEERAQHLRESAMGKAFDSEAKRRAQLEQTRYDTKSAGELAGNLKGLVGEDGKLMSGFDTPEAYKAAFDKFAEAHVRTKFSDTRSIDLLHYSGVDKVEAERFDLDLAMARAKVALRQHYDEKGADMGTASFDDLLKTYEDSFSQTAEANIRERDAIFNKLKRAQVVKAGMAGLAIGSVIGVGVQEGMAHLPGIGSSYYGLGESPATEDMNSNHHSTLLRGLIQGNENRTVVSTASESAQEIGLSGKTNALLPDNFTMTENGSGGWAVTGPDGKHFSDIELQPDGTLTPASHDALVAKGVAINEVLTNQTNLSGETQSVLIGGDHYVIPKEYSLQQLSTEETNLWQIFDENGQPHGQFHINFDGSLTEQGIAELKAAGIELDTTADSSMVQTMTERTDLHTNELIWYNADQVERVHRTLWYGNDTPSNYDLNELRTHAGGVDGSWFDEQGNVVLDISRMSPDGSFQNGQSANPFELVSQNRLSLAVSVDREYQDMVFTFDFVTQPDGRTLAVIPTDSPAYQLFQSGNQSSGHGDFTGRYLEIMEFTGNQDEFGEQVRVLGTYVGENSASGSLRDTIVDTVPVETHTNTLNFTPLVETMQQLDFSGVEVSEVITETNNDVVPAVPIPVYARRGLEAARRGLGSYGYEYGYPYAAQEYWNYWADERSPRLIRDPSADLNPGEELIWYESELKKKRGQAYLDELNGYIEENSETLGSIDNSVKALLCIPVAAANESENIYRTLHQLNEQDPEARASTVVVLNVNWKEELMSDPEQRAKIDKTLTEIERAKADFPDLKVAYFKKEWSTSFVRSRQNRIYGEVIKVLYDAAAVAMGRSVSEGRRSADADALLITNDADNDGRARHYLKRYIDTFESKPEADVFSGTIRRGVRLYGDYPGYGAIVDFYTILNMMAQRQQAAGDGWFTTEGPNSAVKMSMYAAIGGAEDRIGAGADAVLSQRVNSARIGWGREGSRTWKKLFRKNQPPEPSRPRKVGTYVGGAQIDTLPDRLLGAYKQGLWIAKGWDSFDSGGYEDRSVQLALGDMEREDLKNDFDSIAKRIELNVESFASNWYRNSAVVSSALTFWLGANTEDRKLYEAEWDWSKPRDGAFTFRFTDEGRQLLRRKLMQNSKGQFDPFGTRLRRHLYHETNPGNVIQPKLAEPRMIS